MAYVSHPHHAASDSWVGSLVDAAKAALHRREVYRQTLRELNSLNDRELCDLGLSRAMFSAIASEAAREA